MASKVKAHYYLCGMQCDLGGCNFGLLESLLLVTREEVEPFVHDLKCTAIA